MERLDAILVLGCSGYVDNDFIFCSGVNNSILELSELNDFDYAKVENFLDKTCRLFDCVVDDNNKCSNILNLLYKTLKVIDEKKLNKIQLFLVKHKGCNLNLSLILREDYVR